MIVLLGDIHGNTKVLQDAIKKASNASAIIQVGDFGLFENSKSLFYDAMKDANVPVYFIDGNHDDCSRFSTYKKITRIWKDRELFFIPRGTVMKINNYTIGFMGGASSVDKEIRLKNKLHWDSRENISTQEYIRIFKNSENKKIDILITHCPPTSIVQKHFYNNLNDDNQNIIQNIWEKLKFPKIYCGHMHQSIIGKNYRILDIDELIAIP